MTLQKMIALLNNDLSREYAHWAFYMQAAVMVEGLHRQELRELFLEEAEGEMKHIIEFADVIVGLGGKPTTEHAEFRFDLTDPIALLKEAVKMEEEVVANYTQRQDDADALELSNKEDGRRISVFLDDQILDSRKAVDHMKKLIK